MRWYPAWYRELSGKKVAVAVLLPFVQVSDQAVGMVDKDGDVLGGLLGTLSFFPNLYTEGNAFWQEAIDAAAAELAKEPKE